MLENIDGRRTNLFDHYGGIEFAVKYLSFRTKLARMSFTLLRIRIWRRRLHGY